MSSYGTARRIVVAGGTWMAALTDRWWYPRRPQPESTNRRDQQYAAHIEMCSRSRTIWKPSACRAAITLDLGASTGNLGMAS